MTRRLILAKTVLWSFVGILAVLTAARFFRGLGAVTNLSDAAPWGFWIAFDVMGGVALAAGGFVLAGTVYIFGLERYRPFVRPAILTAFLGYVAVAVGLTYDLGLPWHIWHPMVHWQPRSVLFEVALCVMTYLTVLALESAPLVLEHPLFGHRLFQRALAFLKQAVIPLVIAGIVLSTLHQSSLGSLFLIAPDRLHPLWYSPILYVLFFVSAVGLGLMTVTLESLLSGALFRHKVRTDLLSGLGLAAACVLALYAALRVGDLAWRGVLGSALDGSPSARLFLAELTVSALLPAALLAFRAVRTRAAGLAVCAALTAGGMVLNRLDIALFAFARPEGMAYVPSVAELAVSAGILAVMALVFLFAVEHLNVYGRHETEAGRPARPPVDPVAGYGLLPEPLAAPRRYSLAAVAGAALTVLFLPGDAIFGARPTRTPVAAAREVAGLRRPGSNGTPARLELLPGSAVVPAGAAAVRLLMIDGNRDGNAVLFHHEGHVTELGGDASCAVCHHLAMPLDRNASCCACHRDMHEPTPAFDHASHAARLGGNAGCAGCHPDPAVAKTRETATACDACHGDLVAAGSLVEPPGCRWRDATGYRDALHGLCVACHEREVKEEAGRRPEHLGRCDTCHDADRPGQLRRMAPYARTASAIAAPPGRTERRSP